MTGVVKRRLKISLVLLALVAGSLACSPASLDPGKILQPSATEIFINELHYDNDGNDIGEAIEIAAPGGTDLAGWSLVLYNGNDGAPYDTKDLSGVVIEEAEGYGALAFDYPANGIQNGAPDGVALVNPEDEVTEFLSYEGEFEATEGPAMGQMSEDIGVREGSSTQAGTSLQRTGSLNSGWTSAASSFGSLNVGQVFGPPTEITCEPGVTFTLIHDIQGDGAASPLADSEVIIEGVVTGAFQNEDASDSGDLDGFFVQEEDADTDENAATSEGIFVFAPGANDVAVGDLVRVSGTVEEFSDNTQISTVLGAQTGIAKCGVAATPQVTELSLPLAATSDLEAVESMYVVFPQNLVISEFFEFDRFGEVVLAQPIADQDRLYQPTAVAAPGSDEAAAIADLNARSRISVDDGRTVQNPDPAIHPNGEVFALDNAFRAGDTVANATGILNYAFRKYRLQPTQGADYTPVNPRSEAPEDVGGSLKIASFNVLNFFNGDGQGGGFPTERGADDAEELTRQRAKIVSALAGLDADIVGLIELENDASGPFSAIAELTNALNVRLGANTYDYLDTGVIGGDAIRVALIYKPASLSLDGDFAALDSDEFVDPQNTGSGKNRPALAQTFTDSEGSSLTVVVNHLKSKGSDCGAGDDDPEQGNCNGTRTLAAQALTAWLASDPTGSGDPDVLIIGDLNAYDQEDPITVLTQAGYTDLNKAFGGELAYSYVFNGQFGYLDYALASSSLTSQVTGAAEWHINSDEPDILDYDTGFKQDAQDALYEPNAFRASDHDPVLVGLELTP